MPLLRSLASCGARVAINMALRTELGGAPLSKIRAECGGKGRTPVSFASPHRGLSHRLSSGLTGRALLCSLAPSRNRYEFGSQPTCAGAQPAVAGGECLHGAAGADAAVSGPCAGRAGSERRLVSDFQLHGMARSFTTRTASGIRSHRFLPNPGAAGNSADGV